MLAAIPDSAMNTAADSVARSRPRLSRRSFLALGGVAVAGAATAGYMRGWEADWFEVHTETLPRARFPAPVGCKILHLADLHYGPCVSLEMIAEAFRLGLAEKPDLICLTGDYVTGLLRDAGAYADTLRVLSRAAPTFACTGNHDGMPGLDSRHEETHHGRVAAMLRASGIRYLHNERATVAVRGATLTVAGLGDLWADQNDPRACFGTPAAPAADTPVILLNHNPDGRVAAMPYPWHLMLSGHTHGGQCGLPWLAGALAPVRDKSHLDGLRERDGRLIHITRGVGNHHGMRLLCRPQVSLLVVR